MIDLTGKTFHKLKVLQLAGKNKWGQTIWDCQCSCGNLTVVTTGDLNRNHKQSCGCVKKDMYLTGRANKKDPSVSALNQAYSRYRYRATRDKLEFNMSVDDFKILSKGNCFYCGIEPKQVYETKSKNGNYVYNGIDRVDNSKGYIQGNMVSCCRNCNFEKNDISIEMVAKIHEFITRKTK